MSNEVSQTPVLEQELKDCPCCGFKAKIKGGGTSRHGPCPAGVFCPRCKIGTELGDREVQVAIWNSRVVRGVNEGSP